MSWNVVDRGLWSVEMIPERLLPLLLRPDSVPAAGLPQRRGALRGVARRRPPLHRHRGRRPRPLEGLPRQRQTRPRRAGTYELREPLSLELLVVLHAKLLQ